MTVDAVCWAWRIEPRATVWVVRSIVTPDMTDDGNKGKTEDDLHKRDSGSYAGGPDGTSKWKYSGVCYADSILG